MRDFINQQNYVQNFFPINEDEEQLQNMILNADVTLADQPLIDFQEDFLNIPEQNNESLYTQHSTISTEYDSGLNTPVYQMSENVKCESATRSPLSYSEDNVNLVELKNEENLNCLMSNPLFVLSIIPWPGLYDFRVTIPPPILQGVRPKWCFSDYLKKLYVARNVAFPINITLDKYPVGASLNICPVYTKSSNRMVPVFRCPNCRLADRNVEASKHVIQVEGCSPFYFCQQNRYMVSMPLSNPAPGDDSLNVFLRVCCNTSCVGGPNRKPFSILITLKLNEREIGRQVIDVKCCEGPLRDMGAEEKREKASQKNENDMNDEVRQVAADVANIKRENLTKKRKMPEISVAADTAVNVEGNECLQIPNQYVKRVKRYVNHLHMRDQLRKLKNGRNLKKFFMSATSESD